MTQEEETIVRLIVREEIVAALRVLGRAACSEDGYDTPEITSRALSAIEEVTKGTVRRLTCDHRYRFEQPSCWDCGEPEPSPANPFAEPCNHAYALDDSPNCMLCGKPHKETKDHG